MNELNIECFPSMVKYVREVLAGEYDINGDYKTILDIGANVGAFTAWALHKWPNASVTCYEPHPLCYELLQRNALASTLHNVAVLAEAGEVTLYDGINQLGESSVHNDDPDLATGRTSRIVSAISARELPPCDLLKIDTEGCELEIISNYPHLDACRAVVLEFHSYSDRYEIGTILMRHGLVCFTDVTTALQGIGLMKWVRP